MQFLSLGRVAVLAIAPLVSTAAPAQDYPQKKITMIVGFAPGGGVDTLARVVAQEIADQSGLQVVVENRPGAGSNIAAKVVATAPPDGATVLFTGNSYAINQTIYRNPGYETADLRPVAFAAIDSQALVVNADNPAKNLSQFIAAAKDKPPTFGFGGSSSRIVTEYLLRVLAKTEAVAVPFQSGAPALNALLGKHIEILSSPISEVVPHVQQGVLRAMAVTGSKRSHALPDVPTLNEAGFPGLEIHGWIGILAPSKTPDATCAILNKLVNAAVSKPAVNQRLHALGYDPNVMPLADTAPFLTNSIETWRKMILATGMTIN
jgi:tripartite-type tricarboxylate transporter receptor subunit TctC